MARSKATCYDVDNVTAFVPRASISPNSFYNVSDQMAFFFNSTKPFFTPRGEEVRFHGLNVDGGTPRNLRASPLPRLAFLASETNILAPLPCLLNVYEAMIIFISSNSPWPVPPFMRRPGKPESNFQFRNLYVRPFFSLQHVSPANSFQIPFPKTEFLDPPTSAVQVPNPAIFAGNRIKEAFFCKFFDSNCQPLAIWGEKNFCRPSHLPGPRRDGS